VVSANFAGWTAAADARVRETRRWRSTIVDYAKATAPAAAAMTSLRWRFASALARQGGSEAAPWWVVTRAYSRAHAEIVEAALAEPADFFYGGTTGGLAATAEAARRAGKPYALDLEDWHTAESVAPEAALQHGLAARVEGRVLEGARFLTAGSAAIAGAYAERYAIRPVPIHNVFPLPSEPPPLLADGPRLRVCWFGQTIGPDRGLDEVVEMASRSGAPIDLDLRGRVIPGYGELLRARADSSALRIEILDPTPPDAVLAWCREYHVGISAEPPIVENRRLCLSNKICGYLLAGLAVVASDTPGQRPVAGEAGEGVAWYPPGETASAAAALRRWSEDRAALARARRASWEAARTRWHWEHREERGRVLELVAGVFA
jgi:glycosyltransferase involved in cell wall biosynthesis